MNLSEETKIYNSEKKEEDEILRKKLPPVILEKEDKKELRDLIKKMRVIMKSANGIGLSANQIGLEKRIFVAEVPDEQGRSKFYTVINPEIVKKSKEKLNLEEGCLSIPKTYGEVERSSKVILTGYNLQGKKLKIKAWGLLARVFQHEVDHLDGKLFIDRTKNIKKHE